MNWSRVKTVFIILFLICDLFLLSTLMISEHKRSEIPAEVIDSTVTLLKKNNIELNPGLISKRIVSMPYREVENVIDDYKDFAQKLLGNNARETASAMFEGENGSINFSGDSFSAQLESLPEFTDTISAEAAAVEFLANIGFDLASSKRESTKNGDTFTVSFSGYFDDFPLFGAEVTVEFSNVAKISGTWFNPAPSGGEDYPIKSAPSILIDSMPDLALENETVTISALDFGYTVPEGSAYHKSAVLVPSLKITTASQKTYFADARALE